jgi:hypothetical protein
MNSGRLREKYLSCPMAEWPSRLTDVVGVLKQLLTEFHEMVVNKQINLTGNGLLSF